MTLTKYINHRLGNAPRAQAKNLLSRPFGAVSFAEFWQYWNPVWGYYLLYYSYRPLRKHLPRPISVWLTFVVCGLVHDLPFAIAAYLKNGSSPLFTITTFFTLIGSLVVITEKVGFQFAKIPIVLRWVLHTSVILIFYRAALYFTTPH